MASLDKDYYVAYIEIEQQFLSSILVTLTYISLYLLNLVLCTNEAGGKRVLARIFLDKPLSRVQHC